MVFDFFVIDNSCTASWCFFKEPKEAKCLGLLAPEKLVHPNIKSLLPLEISEARYLKAVKSKNGSLAVLSTHNQIGRAHV